LVAVVVGYMMIRKKRRQEKEIKKIRKDYNEAIDKKEQLSKEMDLLKVNHEQLIVSEQEVKSKLETVKANNNQMINAKEKEIAVLNDKIRDYAKRLLHSDKMVGGNPQFTLLIEDFHKKAERKRNTSLPTKLEWEHFLRLFAQTQPKAYAAIGREQTLSPQELKACIFLLMKFANSEVISLLNVSPQSLTNIKTRINEKLFGESNASTLDRKIKEIPIV
jgi:rubrerythrin